MKFSKYLFILIIPFVLVACSKSDTSPGNSDHSDNTENSGNSDHSDDDKFTPLPGGSFEATYTRKAKDETADTAKSSNGGAVFGISTELEKGSKRGEDGEGFVIFMKDEIERSYVHDFKIKIVSKESKRLTEGTYEIYSTSSKDFKGLWCNLEGEINGKGFDFRGTAHGTLTITKSTADKVEGSFEFKDTFQNKVDTKVEGTFTAIHLEDIDKVMEY